MRRDSTGQEGSQLPLHEAGHLPVTLGHPSEEGLEMRPQHAMEHCLLGVPGKGERRIRR